MTLSLVFLIIGAAVVTGSSVFLRAGSTVGIRSASLSAVTAGALMFLIGLVNTLSVSSG